MRNDLRLFIAIPLPEKLCEQLGQQGRDTVEERHRVTWVRPEAMHLTLKFLGSTPSSKLAELQDIGKRVVIRNPCADLSLAKPGVFRQKGIPRVLWWGLKGDVPQLVQLTSELEKELTAAGFPKSEKPFKPHITLGRIKTAEPDMADPFLAATLPLASQFAVESVELIQSTLHPDGARYRVISHFMLKTSVG